jgi:hypothetical protein
MAGRIIRLDLEFEHDAIEIDRDDLIAQINKRVHDYTAIPVAVNIVYDSDRDPHYR